MKYSEWKTKLLYEIRNSKLYFLSITFVDKNDFTHYGNIIFHGRTPNMKWIYSLSYDLELLCRYKDKILEFTSLERQENIKIDILPSFMLSDREIIYNFVCARYNYNNKRDEMINIVESGMAIYKYLDTILDYICIKSICNTDFHPDKKVKLVDFKQENWTI